MTAHSHCLKNAIVNLGINKIHFKRQTSKSRPQTWYSTKSPATRTTPAAFNLATIASICSAELPFPSNAPTCRKNGISLCGALLPILVKPF